MNSNLEAVIVQRLRAGEKAKHVAADLRPLGASLWKVYSIAFVHDIKLKQGRPAVTPDPVRYAKNFDANHGRGAAARLLKLAKTEGFRQTGQAFGCSRQWIHQCYYQLGGKREQLAGIDPAMREKLIQLRLGRPDITPKRVRWYAKHCRSQQEMIRHLRCSYRTIRRRAEKHNIKLPKGHKRWDITPAKMRWAAKRSRSAVAMARLLGTSHSTIFRRAKEDNLRLPNGRKGPRPKTLDRLKRVRRYLWRRYPMRKIVKLLQKSQNTIYHYLRMYPEYFAGIPRRRRRPRRMPAAA